MISMADVVICTVVLQRSVNRQVPMFGVTVVARMVECRVVALSLSVRVSF